MRPTTSTMLQQNNNNNYPCLNMSGSTREMLQKCSRGSLPFPTRLELGLGDLPLVRGLRAWALCSKNRRKASSLLGGGQAPTTPPASRGSSTSCPRPADVYPAGEWGRMGYGLPLGLDARQAGIGALVTVATLKTSEGGGKTQTQCLFLRTEKGSCLYSTAKPGASSLGLGPGVTHTAASTLVGGWLRGKAGGGGGGPSPPAQAGANRARVRSGRRWRKSCNQEREGLGRERRPRSREEAAGEIILEERQEERDKGGSLANSQGGKQTPSPQQDSRRGRQEKAGGSRSPKCCHNTPAKTCTRCGRRAERREGQEGHEGGEGPRDAEFILNRLNNKAEGTRKEKQEKVADEEEDRGGLSRSDSPSSTLVVPNGDLESNQFYLESHSGSEVGETETSCSKDVYSEREEDSNSQTEVMKILTGNNDSINSHFGRDVMTDDFTLRHKRDFDAVKSVPQHSDATVADVNGFVDHVVLHRDSQQESVSLNGQEETQTESLVTSHCCSPRKTPEPATPAGGSTSTAEHEAKQENSNNDGELDSNKGNQQQEANSAAACETDSGKDNTVIEKLHEPVSELNTENSPAASAEDTGLNEEPQQNPVVLKEDDQERHAERGNTSPRLGHRNVSVSEAERGPSEKEKSGREEGERGGAELNEATEDELAGDNRAEELEQENLAEGQRGKPKEASESEAVGREEGVREELHKGDDERRRNAEEEEEEPDGGDRQEGNRERGQVKGGCPANDDWGAQESAAGWGAGGPCALPQLVEETGMKGGGGGREVSAPNVTRAEQKGSAGRPLSPSPVATNVACSDPSASRAPSPANPAPSPTPPGAMATGLPRLELASEGERAGEGERGEEREPARPEEDEEERGSAVAAELGEQEREEEEEDEEEEEEEDEFGVFMQAEGEPAWSEGFAMSASVPCGSRESAALGNHAIAGESAQWTSGWTDSSFHQSEDTWTAFPQDSGDEGRDAAGQWWPVAAVEERRDRLSANQNLSAVFVEAFPSPPGPPSCDADAVPTLTELLRGSRHRSRAGQEQGLLDSFHDLNKMIGQRYKRASGVSRDLLLKTLHLDAAHLESRTSSLTTNRRLSPGLPSANQHGQNAAAKRRLSYDYNRNIME
ncbi:sarcoplasmic reticulum histidine-rich calcium-binding protein [Myripristis murdjan]|uniref:sarcoplasmic reticulum histidine-rich calcium-binding protein n=1 Tax=Myripristis murdjan TaxID=586833 RepID=UPI001175D077|nr:sarcoplasmic reticulum histidine-rich calcium-binding protein-like [Myripristis murdjan]